MKSYSVIEVNKIIRKCLKESFPGVKFSVKKDRWTVCVNYTDGPNVDQVRSVVGRFQGAGFDGMEDYQYSLYHEENGEPVRICTDYIFINRDISQEKIEKRKALDINKHLPGYELDHEVRKQFNKISYCFTQESKTAARFACVGSELEKREKARAEAQEKKNAERAEKARQELAERSNKYSNLSIKNKPVSVLVHWSESPSFTENQELPFEEFEKTCKHIILLNGPDRGYDKTKVTVTFEDGDTFHCRLDLSESCDNGFIDHINQMIEFANTEKGREYYLQHGPELIDFLNSFYVETKAETKAELSINLH